MLATCHQQRHQREQTVFACAQRARRTPTPLEAKFREEARRWPSVSWRRYHPVTIRPFADSGPSTWYAPLLCVARKLIVVLEDRPEFPYRVYGQNCDLYARQGYTVLDFSEDFSCAADESVWGAAMAMIDRSLQG